MPKWLNWLFPVKRPEEIAPPAPQELDGKLVIIKAGFEPGADGEDRIRVEVDYDDIFVKSLRAKGYTGTSDHNIVMRYVADVYRSILQNNNLGYD